MEAVTSHSAGCARSRVAAWSRRSNLLAQGRPHDDGVSKSKLWIHRVCRWRRLSLVVILRRLLAVQVRAKQAQQLDLLGRADELAELIVSNVRLAQRAVIKARGVVRPRLRERITSTCHAAVHHERLRTQTVRRCTPHKLHGARNAPARRQRATSSRSLRLRHRAQAW